ncbi:MAG: hypothetical protein ATN35_00080 [Epulopiscium sp. Nele67-Bin004]|nr:MAG: hypothetical protein ATN35_00080 [Epulopiscium sp. Nele67-Bin004]
MSKSKVTIKQIAEESGLSTATVSRVLHAPDLVKEESRQKIQNIINKHKYAYSAPIDKKSRYIGIIFPDMSNAFYAGILTPFVEAFHQNFPEHELIYYYSCDIPEKEFEGLNFFQRQQCEAIIIIPTTKYIVSPDVWNKSDIPIIWLERTWDAIKPLYAVFSNKELAAYEAVSSLLRNNIKSILMINGSKHLYTAQAREKGMVKAITEHNLNPENQYIEYGEFTWAHGYATIKNFNLSKIDAIIAGNHSTAQGALQGLMEKNISIPNDIAFISFDEIESFSSSNISTVSFSGKEMSMELVNVLEKILNGNLGTHIYYMNANKVLRGSEIRSTR